MISITQIEAAINHWRANAPSKAAAGHAISQQVNALAEVYGAMIAAQAKEISEDQLTDMQKECLTPILGPAHQDIEYDATDEDDTSAPVP